LSVLAVELGSWHQQKMILFQTQVSSLRIFHHLISRSMLGSMLVFVGSLYDHTLQANAEDSMKRLLVAYRLLHGACLKIKIAPFVAFECLSNHPAISSCCVLCFYSMHGYAIRRCFAMPEDQVH
jgi:hypothetical protein